MARRPKKITINETDYKVVTRSKKWGIDKEAYGQITYSRKMIEIADGQTPQEYLDTVIHEVVHGIIEEYGVEMDRRKEEKFVTQFSNSLTDVLKKNPNFVAWLNEQSKK